MKERKILIAALAAILLAAVTIPALLLMPGWKHRGRSSSGFSIFMPTSSMVEATGFGTWKEAVEKVKEDRGEPTGKQAEVDIPPQLRHYSDTRRFLAIQVAEWRKYHFETPQDFVDLARMIGKGEMAELKPVGDNYIIFGVGGNADTEPFTHYEKSSGKSIPLYSESELAQAQARTTDTLTNLENEIGGLRKELSSAGKRERSRRAKLQGQIRGKEKAFQAEQERREQLDAAYGDAQKRQQLFDDYQTLENLAKSYPDQTYSIADAHSRQELKVRMLSTLRPEALKVLEEVSSSYRQQFDRPLPVTSLVRPDEYQHMLSRVNPNATLIETPPHSTGLAFDILYRYMTAEEQAHVMADLARLETEGRIEVLRENRDHYHVFAFVDGARPDETLISESLGPNRVKAPVDTKLTVNFSHKVEKKVAAKVSGKNSVKDSKKDSRKESARKQSKAKSKRR